MSGEVTTLVAVALGGVISAGTALLLDAETDGRELRITSRYVVAELIDAQEFIEGVLQGVRLVREELQADAWKEYGPGLARLLPHDEWAQVHIAYRRIEEMQIDQARGELSRPLSDSAQANLEDHHAEIDSAVRVLRDRVDAPVALGRRWSRR